MISVKTKEEIKILKEGGKKLRNILDVVSSMVKPGIKISELNNVAEKMAKEDGDFPAFLDYMPEGAKRGYPSSLCVSVNNEVVHGIPTENDKVLKEGDIVGLDMGLIHKNLVTDASITVPVGKISKIDKKLIAVTKKALMEGIKQAVSGNHIGDIGFVINKIAEENGFSVAEELAGHGVGHSVHEDPYVPNFGEKGSGPILKEGMVIAIEPMINIGNGRVKVLNDGFTFITADGKNSAHFEHTIAITKGKPIILTK